jgi:hypothetical protein
MKKTKTGVTKNIKAKIFYKTILQVVSKVAKARQLELILKFISKNRTL